MKTFTAAILVAALSMLSTVAQAAPDATLSQVREAVTARFDLNNPASLKGYVRITLNGWNGPAFRLADDAARTDAVQPGTLMFDGSSRLTAVGFSRGSNHGVEVMDLESLSFWHLDVNNTVAAR